MVNLQNPFDQAEKKREEARDSGYTNWEEEKVIDKKNNEAIKEMEKNLRPEEQEDLAEKIREKEFKKEEKEKPRWWQFWRS